MTDQTPTADPGVAADTAPATQTAPETGAPAADPAAPGDPAAANEAAQAAGFADAAAKADFEAAAATQKPRRKRAAARPKAKDGGFSVKLPTPEQFELLVRIAAVGGVAQFVLADGRKPIEGLRPVIAPATLRRGRPTNAVGIAFTGAGLEHPVTVSHVFALDAEDKPTAQPLAIAELAAPVHLGPGEQFRIDEGGIAFFAPSAAVAAS